MFENYNEIKTKLEERVEKLEKYGKSVYEAIQMLSEDYTSKESGKTALYNGILSKLDKYDFVLQYTKSKKNNAITRKYYIHRTLRKVGKEIYICNDKVFREENDNHIFIDGEKILTSTNNKYIRYFTEKEAKYIRNTLNKKRETKLYLWVISKVEE